MMFVGNTTSPSWPNEPAATLANRLEQRPKDPSWGLLKTLILGIPTFGLLPLLSWTVHFRDYADDEARAMGDLTLWVENRGCPASSVIKLRHAVVDVRPSPLPLIFAILISALIVGVFIIQYCLAPFAASDAIDWTYQHGGGFRDSLSMPREELLYRIWTIGLSIGYGVQWLHVCSHAAKVRRFVGRFNAIAAAESLAPVRFKWNGWIYVRPLWILTAVILTSYGAIWAIPMVLAGLAQRKYTRLTGPVLRSELARRVRYAADYLPAPRAASAVGWKRCANPRCSAPLRSQARFCHRCGCVAQDVSQVVARVVSR